MRYDLFNPTKAARIIYDGLGQREIRLVPGGEIFGIALSDTVAANLLKTSGQNDIVIEPHDPQRKPNEAPARPAIRLDGRYGIGDAIHQRGVIRELMVDHDVWLATCHFRVYEDLVSKGLNLIFKPCKLHAQAKTIERERALFPHAKPPPDNAPRLNLSYNKAEIDKYGSILEAMAGCVGVKARPLDFSLPVPRAWVEAFKARFSWNILLGRPILVYRPIVLRKEWNGANRNPDPAAYSALFRAIRDKFFVVSVADLEKDVEWIVGQEEDADVKLHGGELSFEDMAALWLEAALVFSPAGFAPVLAQAVGTPSVVVYGGRESYRTTQRAGAHLAPTLGIDQDAPCDCHTERHDCGQKSITLAPALERLHGFVGKEIAKKDRRQPQGVGDAQAHDRRAPATTLIFATTYVDSGDREQLTRQWLDLHTALNPECDFLLVDSASPKAVLDPEWRAKFEADPQKFKLFDFGDNVGHLSRGGRDGWGRAFCKGLDYAVVHGYDYVAHIEGDSLLRTPVCDLVAKLKETNKGVASIPVKGTTREFPNWVETGLMIFKGSFLRGYPFSANYDWAHREARPTPELVVHHMIAGTLLMLDLKGLRGDKNQIAAADIPKLDLDWITHCHSDIWVYDEFVKANLPLQAGTKSERQGNASPCSLPALPCSTIGAVIGGAPSVWAEIGQTAALVEGAGLKLRYFVVNDAIPLFPGPCVAVSLHPQKLKDWLSRRERAGLPKPDQVWAHIGHEGVTNFTEDWRGSSGLFAIKVALQAGCNRVILCGVPMDAKAGHFVRGQAPWNAAQQFMTGWKVQREALKDKVRSWSGWTAETFGKPDLAFVGALKEAAE